MNEQSRQALDALKWFELAYEVFKKHAPQYPPGDAQEGERAWYEECAWKFFDQIDPAIIRQALTPVPDEKAETSLADQLFDATAAECKIEKILCDASLDFDSLGWDHYDCSLEIRGAAPDVRLTKDVQEKLYKAGFAKIYVNHTDKWETHYGPDISDGWRVCYMNKFDGKEILVEKFPATWPEDWLKTGYVVVVDKALKEQQNG